MRITSIRRVAASAEIDTAGARYVPEGNESGVDSGIMRMLWGGFHSREWAGFRCAAVTGLLAVLCAWPVEGAQESSSQAAPDAAATLTYIHKSWDDLSRSMTDCHSLVDVKVASNPVLIRRVGSVGDLGMFAYREKARTVWLFLSVDTLDY